jgi:hypothetical protein
MPSAMRREVRGPDILIQTPSKTLDTSPPDSEYDVGDSDDVDISLQHLVNVTFSHQVSSVILC